MRFSVSLPALDTGSSGFRRTLESVFHQSILDAEPEATIEIFVVSPDGADDLGEIFNDTPSSVTITHISDSRKGLYAALAASFALHTGDANGYLGAGDSLEPQTLKVVSETLEFSDATPSWITGSVVTRRADGAIVRVNLPAAYSARGLVRGRYSRVAPSIQQESTWWNRRLHTSLDLRLLSSWKLAGDYFLWKSFSEQTPPTVVESVIGSFRWHGDNMSQDWDGYVREVDRMCGPLSFGDRATGFFYRGAWALPNRLKWRLSQGRVKRWSWPDGPWI